ncbi:MAG: DedA family protein [Chloroflexi bacterium]|nr:MAG: DedA family protein [Chloroflexota bacterium]
MSFLDPQTIILTGGLIAITAIIFAECGLLIGFFLPGDSLLFTAGFLAFQQLGGLDIWVLSILCGVAAALGPLVGYWYGNLWGPRLFSRDDSLLFHKQNLVRAHEFYERHGGKALILARFMPVVRTFAPVVAGMASMEYRRFVGYTVIGAVVWAVGVTWLGYFLGSLLGPDGGKYLEYIVAAIIIASIAPPVIHVLRERGKSNEVLTRP